MGRFWIENEIIDGEWFGKLSGNDFKVLLKITRHYNKHGKCFPSIRKISELGNLHHTTVKKSLNKLELLGFLEQLLIKERCKLRYKFTKTARFLFVDCNNVLEKPDTKETFKENYKEENKFLKETKRTPEEQARINKQLALIRKNLTEKFGLMKKKEPDDIEQKGN